MDYQDSNSGSRGLAQMQSATANAGTVRPSQIMQKSDGPQADSVKNIRRGSSDRSHDLALMTSQ